MTDFAFTQACVDFPSGDTDWDTADLRTALFYTGTNVATLRDGTTLSGVTNEYDDSGYTAGGYVHTTQQVNRDDANNQSELELEDPSWTMSGDASGNVVSAVVLRFDTSTANSVPLSHHDAAYTNAAGVFTLTWGAEQVMKITAS